MADIQTSRWRAWEYPLDQSGPTRCIPSVSSKELIEAGMRGRPLELFHHEYLLAEMQRYATALPGVEPGPVYRDFCYFSTNVTHILYGLHANVSFEETYSACFRLCHRNGFPQSTEMDLLWKLYYYHRGVLLHAAAHYPECTVYQDVVRRVMDVMMPWKVSICSRMIQGWISPEHKHGMGHQYARALKLVHVSGKIIEANRQKKALVKWYLRALRHIYKPGSDGCKRDRAKFEEDFPTA